MAVPRYYYLSSIRQQQSLHSKQTFLSLRSLSSISAASNTNPVVELREDQLYPHQSTMYIQETTKQADLRKTLMPHLKSFSLPDTGGLQLHTATHLYYYGGGQEERNQSRSVVVDSNAWKSYGRIIGASIATQKSDLFVEAPLVYDSVFDGQIVGLRNVSDSSPSSSDSTSILEFRRYNLVLGYDTVPKFLEYYQSGLPSKLATISNPTATSLVTVLVSEVGRLNHVIELWKHGSTADMEASRVAARQATEWKAAIANIAPLAVDFHTSIHTPLSFSPLR